MRARSCVMVFVSGGVAVSRSGVGAVGEMGCEEEVRRSVNQRSVLEYDKRGGMLRCHSV